MPETFKLPDFGGLPDQIVRRAMPEIVEAVEDQAVQEAPARRGLASPKSLRSQIHGVLLAGGLEGAVQATARHAHLIHDGTQSAGRVEASAKPFRVPSGGSAGGIVVRRSFEHHGVRANPFLDRAAVSAQGAVEEILGRAGEAELSAVAGEA